MMTAVKTTLAVLAIALGIAGIVMAASRSKPWFGMVGIVLIWCGGMCLLWAGAWNDRAPRGGEGE